MRVGTATGQTRRLAASGPTKGAAKRALLNKLRDLPTSGLAGEGTLAEAWDEWLAYARKAGKPSASSLRTYQATMRTTLAELGTVRLHHLTTPLLADHIETIAADTPRKPGRSPQLCGT